MYPERMVLRWVATLMALILAGCATTVELPTEPPAPRGEISAKPGRPGVVVAAPHGTSDLRTADIAAEVARRTGFGLVVATGFSVDPGARDTPARRYQVNRPSEGTPGQPLAQERVTDAARRVYQSYEARVRETAQGPLRFYAEIDDNNRRDCGGQIEIAAVGVRARGKRQRLSCALRVGHDMPKHVKRLGGMAGLQQRASFVKRGRIGLNDPRVKDLLINKRSFIVARYARRDMRAGFRYRPRRRHRIECARLASRSRQSPWCESFKACRRRTFF